MKEVKLSNKSKEKIKKLHDFLLSEKLEELSDLTEQFNIFTALKLHNNEIRHSNFLGWLMAPNEKHGIGDYFLKEFLKIALKEFSQEEKIKAKIDDVIFEDFSNTEIRREYKNIDLLIINHKSKFLCVVENKIWSGEHSNQLQKYAGIVENEFKDYDKKIHIFLAPNIDDTKELIARECQKDEFVHYIPMNYEQIGSIIQKILKSKTKFMDNSVKIFIEHYLTMIERQIMAKENPEVIALCRKIYNEHKEAIELINLHANVTTELLDNVQEVFKNELEFISKDMFSLKGLKEPLKSLILLQFEKNPSGFAFCINIATAKEGKENERLKLIEHLEKELKISFITTAKGKWHYCKIADIPNSAYYSIEDAEKAKEYLNKTVNETGFITNLSKTLDEYLIKN